MATTDQVHSKFKMFTGSLADRAFDALAAKVAGFVRESGVAPKSIGAEYLESAGKLILTIGYRDDEPGYPVTITSTSLGRFEQLGEAELSKLEKAMEQATSKVSNIICHELFITGDRDVYMVFMTA